MYIHTHIHIIYIIVPGENSAKYALSIYEKSNKRPLMQCGDMGRIFSTPKPHCTDAANLPHSRHGL